MFPPHCFDAFLLVCVCVIGFLSLLEGANKKTTDNIHELYFQVEDAFSLATAPPPLLIYLATIDRGLADPCNKSRHTANPPSPVMMTSGPPTETKWRAGHTLKQTT